MLAYSDGAKCSWEEGLGKHAKLEGVLWFWVWQNLYSHLMVLAWVLGLSRGRHYLRHSDVDKSLVHSILDQAQQRCQGTREAGGFLAGVWCWVRLLLTEALRSRVYRRAQIMAIGAPRSYDFRISPKGRTGLRGNGGEPLLGQQSYC